MNFAAVETLDLVLPPCGLILKPSESDLDLELSDIRSCACDCRGVDPLLDASLDKA